MFTSQDRDRLLGELIAATRADERITAAALFGSAALGQQDRWSDIDLMVGVGAAADLPRVIADWTTRMYTEHGATAHLDITPRSTVYRVFLLASTLQVDLAFAPGEAFGAVGPSFALIFGAAHPREPDAPPEAAEVAGLGWLYALHARSSLARARPWQAEYMISGLRDQVLTLACLRYDVPAVQARGIDRLPPEATAPLAATLVRSLAADELARAFRAAVEALLAEVRCLDGGLAERLAGPLRALAG